MSAEYPHPASWQQAQAQLYPVVPPYNPAPGPGVVWLPPAANDRTNFALIGAGLILLYVEGSLWFRQPKANEHHGD